jgi:hypothetical protein
VSAVASAARAEAVGKRNQIKDDWSKLAEDIVIGKDVLELLSSSMYIDPMAVYREYVQNAADSIDEARHEGLLGHQEGTIEIHIDPAARTVRIRDDGVGISASRFASLLTSLGGSSKRGTTARGFRGVGRLAGLGYGQELIFRSRSSGETAISEMRWDCRRLSIALRDPEFSGGLAEIIEDVVGIRKTIMEGYPERFFEVELRGIIRHKTDRLLSATAVAEYISQVGPVPFAPSFRFGPDILAAITSSGSYSEVDIRVTGIEGPLYRPHQNSFKMSEGVQEEFTELELVQVPSVDGNIAAVAWILHHGYSGSIPASASVKGIRFRAGNIQVGDGSMLEDLFPEPRFNSWSVGEVHIFDSRVVPNGRRDHFQSNTHFNNVLSHLGPIARGIARRCRTSSIRRNWLRQFEQQRATIREKTAVIEQGVLRTRERSNVERAARVALDTMAKIADRDGLDVDGKLKQAVTADERKLNKILGAPQSTLSLDRLPPGKRKMYEHLFSLVYECSSNRSAAKALIDRILMKIG